MKLVWDSIKLRVFTISGRAVCPHLNKGTFSVVASR